MMLCKKVLIQDDIKYFLISSSNIPFRFKKSYLHALFQIYMTKMGGENEDFKISDMINILKLIVLPDL